MFPSRDLQTDERAQALGIRAYCMKPLTKRDLARVIRDVLDSEGEFSNE